MPAHPATPETYCDTLFLQIMAAYSVAGAVGNLASVHGPRLLSDPPHAALTSFNLVQPTFLKFLHTPQSVAVCPIGLAGGALGVLVVSICVSLRVYAYGVRAAAEAPTLQ